MGKRIFPLEQWPMFEIAVSQQANKSVLHFSMDFWSQTGQAYGNFWKNLKVFILKIRNQKRQKLHLEITFYLKNVKRISAV